MDYKYINDKIKEYLNLYTKLWAFSGAICVIKDGKVIFSEAYGHANIEHEVLNTTETKFRIWSITKQFTAAAILILEEKGLLNVNDSLKKYFEDYTELDERITIHHLLTHTSGIFNYSNLPNAHKVFYKIPHERSELLKLFTDKHLEFEPGTEWSYSNSGYYLLGILIEKLTGMTYSEFLDINIFKPLGMVNTGIDDNKTIIKNKATGYYLNDESLIHCNYVDMDLMISSGGMYSTTKDLYFWDQALNTENLLSKKSIEKMNTIYKNNYGYGVAINMNSDRRVVHHNGGCEGFLTEIHRYVDDNFAVIVLSNYGFTAVNKICKEIAAIVFEEEYKLPSKPEEFLLKDEILESYLGTYEDENCKLEVKREDNKIFFIIDDEYILPMYPISENLFHHTWIDEEYTFIRDEEGQLYFWGVRKKA